MRRALTCAAAVVLLAACGSPLPGVIDALPDELNGHAKAQQALDGDGRFIGALEAEGLATDDLSGTEVRWGDDIRLIALRFESVGMNEASRVALALLGIGDVESQLELIGTELLFVLTGPQIDGVAYQFSPANDGSAIVMYTIVAPTEADAVPILRAIRDAIPSSD
jgi:hypothetical protein